MINVILSGVNGKMGRTVMDCIKKFPNCRIIFGIDRNIDCAKDFRVFSTPSKLWKAMKNEKVSGDIVVIDFSNNDVTYDLIEFCKNADIPLVIGTTALKANNISNIQEAAQYIPIVHSSNMSIGISIIKEILTEYSSRLADAGFDIEIVESHHKTKLDAPSGTALSLFETINTANEGKYWPSCNRSKRSSIARETEEIGIHSIRGGNISGEHTIMFLGEDEEITITHKAISKKIFAIGALRAAEFIVDKKAGLYSMEDIK